MSNLNLPASARLGETITIIGTQNLTPSNSWPMPATSICTYTVADEGPGISAPLSDGAVRLVDSILAAVIPEKAIRRDANEDF